MKKIEFTTEEQEIARAEADKLAALGHYNTNAAALDKSDPTLSKFIGGEIISLITDEHGEPKRAHVYADRQTVVDDNKADQISFGFYISTKRGDAPRVTQRFVMSQYKYGDKGRVNGVEWKLDSNNFFLYIWKRFESLSYLKREPEIFKRIIPFTYFVDFNEIKVGDKNKRDYIIKIINDEGEVLQSLPEMIAFAKTKIADF